MPRRKGRINTACIDYKSRLYGILLPFHATLKPGPFRSRIWLPS
jgi:hypothetical protein